MQLSWGVRTDPGLRRASNEDSYCTRPDLGLFVVADGMGGHAAGEVASREAVENVMGMVRRGHAIIGRFCNEGPTVDNTRAVQRPETALGRRVRATRAFGAVRRAPLPDPARRALRRLVSRPVARPALEPRFRAELADSLGEEIAWLRSFSGQEFASWSL